MIINIFTLEHNTNNVATTTNNFERILNHIIFFIPFKSLNTREKKSLMSLGSTKLNILPLGCGSSHKSDYTEKEFSPSTILLPVLYQRVEVFSPLSDNDSFFFFL